MRLNKKLNFVLPIDRGEDEIIYIHSTPIAFESYEQFAVVLAKCYSQIMSEGLNFLGGPGVAAKMLEQVAKETRRGGGSWWEGSDGIQLGLWPEIRRLTNYIFLQGGAWTPIPLETAYAQGLLDREEVFEVENQLAFFTVFSHSPPRQFRETLLEGMAGTFASQITSSNSTDFAASLPISTVVELSTATRSSVISSTG